MKYVMIVVVFVVVIGMLVIVCVLVDNEVLLFSVGIGKVVFVWCMMCYLDKLNVWKIGFSLYGVMN